MRNQRKHYAPEVTAVFLRRHDVEWGQFQLSATITSQIVWRRVVQPPEMDV